MEPVFLVPEISVQENGSGPPVDIGRCAGQSLLITLGISRIVEQESLDLTIWGSADKQEWGPGPLGTFPQKFYCGTYSLVLDLAGHPDVRWVRAQWRLNRWGRGSLKPLFGFYVFSQPIRSAAAVAGPA